MDEALAMITDQRYGEAAERLGRLASEFGRTGDADSAAKAVFWQGYCYEKGGQADLAAALYRRVIQTWPGTAASQQASERLTLLEPAASQR